jgi:DNA-binding NarL/FixJ family response regulator
MTAPVPSRPIRHILIVDDDAVMEQEAVSAVAIFPDSTVRTARTVGEAERWIRRVSFDLAIVDIGLPDGSGIDVIRRLVQHEPTSLTGQAATPICLARTVFDDDDTLFSAISAGATGYLLKGESEEQFRTRVRAAVAGEPVVSPAIARRVLAYFRATSGWVRPSPESTADTGVAANVLTPRETEVLRLLAAGHTLGEIGVALSISLNTVKTHVKNTYARLDVTSRVKAIDAARRRGILRDDAD